MKKILLFFVSALLSCSAWSQITNGVRISSLNPAGTLTGAELIPVTQFNGSSNVTYRTTLAAMAQYTVLTAGNTNWGGGSGTNTTVIIYSNMSPQLVVVAATTNSVSLTWNPSSSNAFGYYVLWGNYSGLYFGTNDVGNVTNYTVNGLSSGQLYTFAVKAYDNTGTNFSLLSNEAIALLPGWGANGANTSLSNISVAGSNVVAQIAAAGSSLLLPYVGTFIQNAKISDQEVVNALNIGVNEIANKYGVLNNLSECIIFDPRFGPTNHVALVGNPWSVSGPEKYSAWGILCTMSNCISATLPTGLTNCTLAITYQDDVNEVLADQAGNIVDDGRQVASLISSNDWSGLLLTDEGTYGGRKPFVSVGTNWYANGAAHNLATNAAMCNLSGGYSQKYTLPVRPGTVCVSYNSNGLVSIWWNGSPALFISQAAYQSNLLYEGVSPNPFSTLLIGGNTNWNALTYSGVHTNFQGYVKCVQVYAASCEMQPAIPLAATAFGMCLEMKHKIVAFQGTSHLNYEVPYDYMQAALGIVVTNSIPYLYGVQHPDTYVLQEAFPGSSLPWLTNGWYLGFSPYYTNFIFKSAITLAPPAQFFYKTIFTDEGYNDGFYGSDIQSAGLMNPFNTFYRPFLTNGVSIIQVKSPPSYAFSRQVNLQAEINMNYLTTNFPFADVIPVWDWLTAQDLTNAALDLTHLGFTNTLAGYTVPLEEVQMLSGKVVPTTYQIGIGNGFDANSFAGFYSSPQTTAAVFNWGSIPAYSATTTNYWFGTWTNGAFCCIWSNTASSYAIKQLSP